MTPRTPASHLVHDELRKLAAAKLAQEKPGQMLDAFATEAISLARVGPTRRC